MAVRFVFLLFFLAVVHCDHLGAYSSPQYAKKLYPKQFDSNALLPKEAPPVSFRRTIDEDYQNIDRIDSAYNESSYARSSILTSAGEFLSSTGGQMVSSLAKDFIARSTGSSQVGFDCISQVLSLNLTNLVILVVLKALILAAGFFGAGAWKGGHHYGRSLDDNNNVSYITEDEILLYLSYLAGQQRRDFSCMYHLSCLKPKQAGLYSSGAELLLQGVKLLQGNDIDLKDYEQISIGLKEAAKWGQDGRSCDARYKCGE